MFDQLVRSRVYFLLFFLKSRNMEKATSSAAPAKIGGGGSRRQSDLNRSFKLAIRSLLTSCSKQTEIKQIIMKMKELAKAFSKFSNAEQESLHRLFIQVITSLHKMVEDEFESLCLETQVGTALETVEQLVEEQNLDPLFSEKGSKESFLQQRKRNYEVELTFPLALFLILGGLDGHLSRDKIYISLGWDLSNIFKIWGVSVRVSRSNIMDAAKSLSMEKKNEIHYLTGMLEKAEEQNRRIRDRVELLKQKMPDDSGISVVMEKFKSGNLSYGTCSNGI
ncbi:hypothetical protein POTOM_016504 [Populus tomentosa]|uniref:Uncharacterized protein n=1 Tax=Populus tomentosa TaxID=118781 RepID=A0A8X8A4Z7_POPTO|nr:hypothetical protein POTOM_016504 [Populus tomentosa]